MVLIGVGLGSVGCGTELTQFCNSGFILFIEIHSQNTKIDDGETSISEYILYHFASISEFLVIR